MIIQHMEIQGFSPQSFSLYSFWFLYRFFTPPHLEKKLQSYKAIIGIKKLFKSIRIKKKSHAKGPSNPISILPIEDWHDCVCNCGFEFCPTIKRKERWKWKINKTKQNKRSLKNLRNFYFSHLPTLTIV